MINHLLKRHRLGITQVGVITSFFGTVALACHASFQAKEVLESNTVEEDVSRSTELLNKARVVLPYYGPTIAMASVTLGLIFLNNRYSSARRTALEAALIATEASLLDYIRATDTVVGQKKSAEISEVATTYSLDRGRNELVEPPEGSSLVTCFDSFSGRYFLSSAEEIRRAENRVNYKITHELYVTINDFYEEVGLEPITSGENLGWDGERLLEVEFASTLRGDVPILVISFNYKKSV